MFEALRPTQKAVQSAKKASVATINKAEVIASLMENRKVGVEDWLYQFLATWIASEILHYLVRRPARLIYRTIVRPLQWASPRLMAFLYIRILFRLNLYLVVLPKIARLKFIEENGFLSRFFVFAFFECAARGIGFRAAYSEEGRRQLEELSDDLDGLVTRYPALK